MIDFTTSQLSWIVIGACSIGGTGYLTMNNNVASLDKKIEISNTKAEASAEKLTALQAQLDRIENKLDSRGSR
jgi:hypothetical protein